VVTNFKKNRKTEPTIILAAEDMDILEGMDEIKVEPAKPAAAKPAPKAEAPAPVGIPDLDDVVIETRKETPAPAAAASPDDTVLNLEGLLEDDGSEGTTPIPGAAAKMIDESSDITVEGNVSDETLLDTDLLEIGEEEDSFKMEAGGTPEETAADLATEANLLRGGGARVMQMKRKKVNPLFSIFLAASALLLLAPLGMLLNAGFVAGFHEDPVVIGGKVVGGKDTPYEWIGKVNFMGGVIEGIADF